MPWKLSVFAIAIAAVIFFLQSNHEQAGSSENAQTLDTAQTAVNDVEVASDVMAESVAQANKAQSSDEGVEYTLSESTLLLFDNLIAESEDKSLAVLLEKLQSWMQQAKLNQASQALLQDVFTRYIEYKLALGEVKSAGHEQYMRSAHLADILQAVDDIRYQWFSEEEIALLFSEQQAHDNGALARLRIREDKSLSEADKNRLIAESIAQLPESEQEAFQPSIQIRKAQQLRTETQGMTREQRLARLSAEFGQEAGQRLDNVYQQQDAWKTRVQDFRQQMASLQDDDALSSDERAEQIARLKSSLFNDRELKRLDVFLRNPNLLN